MSGQFCERQTVDERGLLTCHRIRSRPCERFTAAASKDAVLGPGRHQGSRHPHAPSSLYPGTQASPPDVPSAWGCLA
ncbi:hypothetical protein E2C01_045039 [Portunus trituberculatus]|uniref:Uncharacterized protein n=1 Tax=Portunus trituberculatus TaxID=210409 RepID=A0A5B7G225_PORTR|nr:hypothetical protein [Portunus trituberculatus]